MIRKKMCMVGAFAVGKTSLVDRFVNNRFSEDYKTSIGVTLQSKWMVANGERAELVIWDLQGEDELISVRMSYLNGADGYFLVVDGTRPDTLETAISLEERVRKQRGEIPLVLLVNKLDRTEEWSLDSSPLATLSTRSFVTLETSAKTGENVESAFDQLWREMGSS